MTIVINTTIGLAVGLLIALTLTLLKVRSSPTRGLRSDSMLSKSLLHASIRAGSVCALAGFAAGMLGLTWWAAIICAIGLFIVVAVIIGVSTKSSAR